MWEGGDPLGLDTKLAEEREKSVVLDRTLSGGLGGSVCSSGYWYSPGSGTNHCESSTDGGASSGCVLRVGSVSEASCSCIVVSILDCDDESPRVRGRRTSTRESDCDMDEENCVDMGVSPTMPERCEVVEPTDKLEGAVSVMRGEGTCEE